MSLLPIRRVVVVEPDASHRLFVCETLKLFGVPAVEECAALLGREAGGPISSSSAATRTPASRCRRLAKAR